MQQSASTRTTTTERASTVAALEDPYMKEWRTNISTQVSNLAVTVGTVEKNMITRADVAQMMAERVDKETYQVTVVSQNERIAKLEGSPQRLLGWLSLGMGCAAILAAAAVGLFGIIVTIILYSLTHP